MTASGVAGRPAGSRSGTTGSGWRYDAFLSYSHRDNAVASGIQKGLHRVGRRVGQLSALRVFRDDTDLAANPDLWGRVTGAMDASRFMIAVLSPDAAASSWVNQELTHWLGRRGPDDLLLVVAGGHLAWDETQRCFDPDASSAAPPALTAPGVLSGEPLFVDVSQDAPWDPAVAAFRDRITSLAAPIHGKEKYELASEDVREQRRFRTWRRAAVIALIMLTIAAMIATIVAVGQSSEATRQRNEALRQRDQALALALSAASGDLIGANGALALALAAEASGATPTPLRQATSALVDAPVAFTESSGQQHLAPLTGHAGGVNSLAFSPDGKLLATGGSDGTIRLWDPATRKPVGQPLTGHTDPVGTVAFSPDGKSLASGGLDGTALLWDLSQDRPVSRPLPTGRCDPGYDCGDSVVFSPDGRLLATDGGDVRLLDAASATPKGVPLTATAVLDVTFSPDGKLLATANAVSTGAEPGEIHLWDPASGTAIGGPITGLEMVTSVAFSPDGALLASGSIDGSVRLWDPASRKQIGQPLTGHTDAVNSITFSPDGGLLVTGGSDGTIRLRNATTRRASGTPLTGHTDAVNAVTFSPDGGLLASASADGTVLFWDLTEQEPIGAMLTDFGDARVSVAFTSTGGLQAVAEHSLGFLQGGAPQVTAQSWDPWTRTPLGQPLVIPDAPDARVSDASLSPNGAPLAIVKTSGPQSRSTMRVLNLANGDLLGPALDGDSATFSPGGTLVAVVSTEDPNRDDFATVVRLWTVSGWTPIGEPIRLRGYLYAVAVSPDGKRVATSGDSGGTVRLWDAATGQLIGEPVTGHTAIVTSMAFSPDGARLATLSVDNTARLWDVTSGRQIGGLLRHSGDLTALAFTPDGTILATASGSGDGQQPAALRLWDVASSKPIGRPLSLGPTTRAKSLAFDPAGTLLASGGWDGSVWVTAGLWNVEEACALASRYVTRDQVGEYLPSGWETTCTYTG